VPKHGVDSEDLNIHNMRIRHITFALSTIEDKSICADKLGISKRTLYRYIENYNIKIKE
jgi:transcriptional regulator with PAS, ATPase and Fis domain